MAAIIASDSGVCEMQDTVNATQLLLIDDDLKFCRLISGYLMPFGYDVTVTHSGLDGIALATQRTWEVIILDVMLPGIDGFDVLRRLREVSEVPVLMLTSLGDEADRIVGLELGADDYLAKTSSPRELLARLRALLRRASRTADHPATPGEEILIGPLTINMAARSVILEGETLGLTPVEFDLLVVLAQSRGRVKSREELINEIRDRNYDVFDRSVDVHVSALRRKLHEDKKNPRFIKTVRAAGYMFLSEGSSK